MEWMHSIQPVWFIQINAKNLLAWAERHIKAIPARVLRQTHAKPTLKQFFIHAPTAIHQCSIFRCSLTSPNKLLLPVAYIHTMWMSMSTFFFLFSGQTTLLTCCSVPSFKPAWPGHYRIYKIRTNHEKSLILPCKLLKNLLSWRAWSWNRDYYKETKIPYHKWKTITRYRNQEA